MQKAGVIGLKLIIACFAWLPFWFIYFLSDTTSLFFTFIFRYRRKVIIENLKRSFPNKSADELQTILKTFYVHFGDILLESIKGFTLTKKDFSKRFVYKNPEIFDPFFEEGKSIILLGSHFGNWEWGVLSFPLAVKHQVVGIFKPLSNKAINIFIQKLRTRWGLNLVSMKATGKAIIKNKNTPSIFVFIADQTPSDIKNAHWVTFLNQDTPFLHGAEKIAQKTNYPVFYFKVNRKKRGHYDVNFEPLCLQPKETTNGQITTMFAMELEKQVIENPANWLWSHRRWKRKRLQP